MNLAWLVAMISSYLDCCLGTKPTVTVVSTNQKGLCCDSYTDFITAS